MKRLLKEIMTNDCGRYSTTNFIQVISVITIVCGFFYALIAQDNIASELAIVLGGLAFATPASKGYMELRKAKEKNINEHD